MRMHIFSAQHYGLLTIILWATAFAFTPVALAQFSSGSLALIRCAIACLIFCWVIGRKTTAPRQKNDYIRFFFSGMAGFGIYTLIFTKGLETLNPTTSCIIVSTTPIITALLARIFLKERIPHLGWLAIFLAFGGICLMMLWRGTFAVDTGLLWTQAAAFSVSAFNIMQRDLAKRYSAIEITAYSFFMGTLPLLFFAPQALAEITSANSLPLGTALFLGIFPSALGYLSWAKALSLTTKTSRVTNLMFLTPFLALLLEFAVLKQLPDTGTFIGGAVILTSLALFFAAREK